MNRSRTASRLLLSLGVAGTLGCQPTAAPTAKRTTVSRPVLTNLQLDPEPAQAKPVSPVDPTGTVAPVDPVTPEVPVPALPPILDGFPDDDPPPGSLKAIFGAVTAPATVVSNNGGSILSNNAGSLIGNNGGNLIGNNGSSYRVLATAPELGLRGAFLYLTNRDEKFFLNALDGQVFETTTASDGQYDFFAPPGSNFPVAKDVIVNALLDGELRFTGYLVPDGRGTRMTLNPASTLVTELLRGDAYRTARALSAYDRDQVDQVVALTQSAIAADALPLTRAAGEGQPPEGLFDWHLSGVAALRNQYVAAISAVDKADATLKALSDAWKRLLGFRPMAVTTIAGNGRMPEVAQNFYATIGVEGDWRDGTSRPATQVPFGTVGDLAVTPAGDTFIAAYGVGSLSGHIRWLKPNGTVTSLWNSTRMYGVVNALCVEHTPESRPGRPGTLLFATGHQVLRMPIVESMVKNPDGTPIYPIELVAGGLANGAPVVSAASAKTSRWRLAHEGTSPMTTLLNSPQGLAVDELGNIYIADTENHRIRMIVSEAGAGRNYFGYRLPIDDNDDGLVDRFGAPVTMAAGQIYTIAGHARWDAANAENKDGYWYGDFAEAATGQEAQLDRPAGLAFRGGRLVFADLENQRIRRLDRETGAIEVIVGAAGEREVTGRVARFKNTLDTLDKPSALEVGLALPYDLDFDAAGRLVFIEAGANRVRVVEPSGAVRTIAGAQRVTALGGVLDVTGDGEALYYQRLQGLEHLAVDRDGNVLLNDRENNRLRKLWFQWE